ncbi:MAG: hypothetical protein AAF526_11395, partial [Pseudomonadota bacterium]
QEIDADLLRLKEAAEISEKSQNLPRQVQSLYWAARLKYDALDEKGAMALAAKAAALAEPTGDIRMRSGPENLLAFLYSLQGNPARGIALTERNSNDLTMLGDQREATVMTGIYAFALGSGGQYDRANEVAKRAVEMAEDLGHPQSLSVATFSQATILGWEGRTDEARPWVQRAIESANSCRNLFQTYCTHGWAGEALINRMAQSEDYSDLNLTIEHLETALGIAEKFGMKFHVSAFRAHLGHARLREGDIDQAERLVADAMSRAIQGEQIWGLSIAQRIRGEIALVKGLSDDPEVLQGINDAIQHQRTSGLQPELVRTLDLSTRLHAAAGNHRDAESTKAEAQRISASLEATAG